MRVNAQSTALWRRTAGAVGRQCRCDGNVAALCVQVSRPNHSLRGCFCSRRELQLLRALLLRNSRRMQPTAWQRQHLNLGPDSPWLATFITPLYPESLGDSNTFAKAFDAFTPEALQQLEQQFKQKEGAAHRTGQQPVSSGVARSNGRSSNSSRPGPSNQAATGGASTAAAGGAPSHACRTCGAKASSRLTLMRCSRCKADTDWYCSPDCFKADWSRHKRSCRPAK